eukprot:scaffold86926_cov66-Phaeocystis_antarctica.AAC.1
MAQATLAAISHGSLETNDAVVAVVVWWLSCAMMAIRKASMWRSSTRAGYQPRLARVAAPVCAARTTALTTHHVARDREKIKLQKQRPETRREN